MLVVDKSKCNGDSICTMICPVEAISVGEDGKAYIDPDVCMECYTCKESCPQEAIEEKE